MKEVLPKKLYLWSLFSSVFTQLYSIRIVLSIIAFFSNSNSAGRVGGGGGGGGFFLKMGGGGGGGGVSFFFKNGEGVQKRAVMRT